MASAFDDLHPSDADYTRRRLLAGDTMAEIRRTLPGLSMRKLTRLRDEVFEPLVSDPEAVKALANGPVLNPLALIRYRKSAERHRRTARPRATQTEMFAA